MNEMNMSQNCRYVETRWLLASLAKAEDDDNCSYRFLSENQTNECQASNILRNWWMNKLR